ncbi:MAG: PAS domain-containing sensor histidine kinase [Longimicrobiales bacterium]
MSSRIDFDALFENDLDACAIMDARQVVVRINRAFTRLFGYAPEEAVGKFIDDLIVPEHLRVEAASYEERADGRRELGLDTVRKRRDGTLIAVSLLAQLHDNADGQQFFYVQYRDETEKKNAAESLRASEAQLRAVFDNAPVGLVVSDISANVLETNEAFAQMLGRRVDELRGWNVVDFSHPEEMVENVRLRRELLAGMRETFQLEKRYIRGDGTYFWGRLTVALIRTSTGAPLQFVAIVEDVTGPRLAALRREAALRLFTSLIENMRDGVVVESTQRTITAVNPAFLELFGIPGPPDALVDVDCQQAASGVSQLMEDGSAFVRIIEERIAAAEPARDQIRFRDGRVLERDYAPIRDAAGSITGHMWVYHDLTDLLRLQDQLRQSQKMEAVGRLAGGIAHDFNNLLTVLQGHATMLLEEPLPAHVVADLQEIISASNKAANLIRQLLAYSRKQVLKPVILDVNDVLRDLGRTLLRMIREDITLTTVFAENTPTVLADRTQIEQVVLNLAVNARDAMPNGGRLQIRTERLELFEPRRQSGFSVPAGCYALITMTDSGEGIDDHILPQIFDPFFTTKEQGKGTGLGLATVYGIIKQSGGYILVESRKGLGASFRILLPKAHR